MPRPSNPTPDLAMSGVSPLPESRIVGHRLSLPVYDDVVVIALHIPFRIFKTPSIGHVAARKAALAVLDSNHALFGELS
jgi:hypothetical protein